ncbi:uncharacterized protein LOC144704623 [Wolffia australiana]
MGSSSRELPVAIAMKGHPATGKSTLARALAAALHIPLLDKDDVRACTRNLEPTLGPSPLNDLAYAVLFRAARAQLRLGLSVVLDSPLSSRARLDQLLRAAAGAGRAVVVECAPPAEPVWRRRLAARAAGGAGAAWHKPADWAALRRLVEGYAGEDEYELGDVPRLVLDGAAEGVSVEDRVEQVVRFVFGSGVRVKREKGEERERDECEKREEREGDE